MRSGLNSFLIFGVALALLIGVGALMVARSSVEASAAAPSGSAPSPVATNADPVQNRTWLTAAEADAAAQAKLLPPGTRSLLKTTKKFRHGDYLWDEKGASRGKLSIWVDLRTQMISVFRGGNEIGTAVIVYGAEDMTSPVGRFPILSKYRNYHSRTYDAPMPHSLFITNTGVALHGSPMSPRRATHGCIGLPLAFARLLFDAAAKGDRVEIVRSDPEAARRLTHSSNGGRR